MWFSLLSVVINGKSRAFMKWYPTKFLFWLRFVIFFLSKMLAVICKNKWSDGVVDFLFSPLFIPHSLLSWTLILPPPIPTTIFLLFPPSQEISDYDLQELVMKSIGRLTLVRQTFPMPQNTTQRCVKHNHRINTSLCDPKNPKSHQLEVSCFGGLSFYFLNLKNLIKSGYRFYTQNKRKCHN